MTRLKPWAAKLRRSQIISLSMAAALALVAGLFVAQWDFAEAQMGGPGKHRHGADGTGHDMVNMPGLRGLDASPEESAELAVMFRNFTRITRTVTNLPNGIRTVTYSQDPELMSVVASHVTGMIQRVEDGRDPKVMIQSPSLNILFERRDRIKTDIDMTDEGIVVVQTSDDPDVVEALQTHAGEVSDMVDRGMEAVHEAMMKRARRP